MDDAKGTFRGQDLKITLGKVDPGIAEHMKYLIVDEILGLAQKYMVICQGQDVQDVVQAVKK